MTKEEILEKSREENKNEDLAAAEIVGKASKLGYIAGMIVCVVLYAAEIMLCGTDNMGLWSIVASSLGVSFLYSGIKFRKKFRIILGIIWLLVAVASIVRAITTLISTSTIL